MIYSANEWDTLKICVVGDATNANFPLYDYYFDTHKKVTKWHKTKMNQGKLPEFVIDETNEDLDSLIRVLREFNVEIQRPQKYDFSQIHNTEHWASDGYMNYCPRDVLLVIGDTVIETPMSMRSRINESQHYQHLRSLGGKWITADKPNLLDEDISIEKNGIKLSNQQPIFDAANVLRINNDILYLVSSSGNYKGAEWLQQQLGNEYKVHICDDLYASTHIDTTISVLREGLVVLNGERVNQKNCPDIFNNWEKIYVDDLEQSSFWHYPYGSKWMGLNMLSVDPSTVIVDSTQSKLIKQIEQKGITVIPLLLRHARTLGGGFHCVTLDLHRK